MASYWIGNIAMFSSLNMFVSILWLASLVTGFNYESNYVHFPESCVFGENIIKYASKSVSECMTLCELRSDCLGFEYGMSYGGPGSSVNKANDCQLQSSGVPDDSCDGVWHNFDFYARRYIYIPKRCIHGSNIVKYKLKSVDQCMDLCDSRSDCLGFEYGMSYGGPESYEPMDCQLQSSVDTSDCDGAHYNLDFYQSCRVPVPTCSPSKRSDYIPLGCYYYIPRGCVHGSNIVKYTLISVDQCMELCDSRSDCLGFEYGVSNEGSGSYRPIYCQLKSSADFFDCDGCHYYLDFYAKFSAFNALPFNQTRSWSDNPNRTEVANSNQIQGLSSFPTESCGRENGTILSSLNKMYLMLGAIAVLLICIIPFLVYKKRKNLGNHVKLRVNTMALAGEGPELRIRTTSTDERADQIGLVCLMKAVPN